uniref:Uncharacterized protein n=1 Tax=Babesia bovis TaxID=5865 RepID=S6BMR3_BABBO|nr:hypothetical protein [Babesia bovis]
MKDKFKLFSEQVCSLVQEEWQSIPDPNSPEWRSCFNRAVDAYLAGETSTCDFTSFQQELNMLPRESDALSVDIKDREKLALHIHSMMEGLWLAGRKKLDAINQCNRSAPLKISEVSSYAKRLSRTTCSPTENMNTMDPNYHSETYPQYHFLGYPSVSEMHSSRLFDLHRLEESSSAPRVIFEPISADMHRMRLECSTPNAVLYFQTSRVNSSQVDPHTGQPVTYTTAPAVYNPSKNLNFKTSCQPFSVFTWSTCEGLRQSEVVRTEYVPPTDKSKGDVSTKKSFGFLIGRELIS